jgi:uncharacterized membrane protein
LLLSKLAIANESTQLKMKAKITVTPAGVLTAIIKPNAHHARLKISHG